MMAKVERQRKGMASCEGKRVEEFVQGLSGEELFLEARDHESSIAVSDQNLSTAMRSRRHCGWLDGKMERGSDFQRRGGKAQHAYRSENGIEVLTGQWGYGCPGQ